MFIHSPTDMEGSWKSAWQALAELLHVPKKFAFYEMPEKILNIVGSHRIKERKKYREDYLIVWHRKWKNIEQN